MKRSQKLFIQDSIEDIQEFIKGKSYEKFKNDKMVISAVIRKIEISGEAVKNLNKDIIENNTNIPWKKFAQMRDKVIHGYFGVDNKVIWETITKDLPPILNPLKELLLTMKD